MHTKYFGLRCSKLWRGVCCLPCELRGTSLYGSIMRKWKLNGPHGIVGIQHLLPERNYKIEICS